jgi:hypothetical protein
MRMPLRLFFFCIAIGISPALAQGYMDDTISAYSDTWAIDQAVYGYGSLAGSLSYHTYAVDVEISSRWAELPPQQAICNPVRLGIPSCSLGTPRTWVSMQRASLTGVGAR